jgi:hypothetical protein
VTRKVPQSTCNTRPAGHHLADCEKKISAAHTRSR